MRPEGCDILDRAGRAVNPEFDTVWRGDGPTNTQGIKVLGTPLGHEDFVRDHLRRTTEDHMSLLDKIPSLPDVQSAWALLLHCASARANNMLRAIGPELTVQFSADHNAGLWSCLCNILRIAPDQCDELAKDVASLPLCMGGLGLRSAARTSASAFWASWADSLAMIRARHPLVARTIVDELEGGTTCASLAAARDAEQSLVGVEGFEPPSWTALSEGVRPPRRDIEEYDPGCAKRGWQHEASSRVERRHREFFLSRLSENEQATLRSQSGPLAGAALMATPSHDATRIDPHLFRVLLLRRLHLPLPFVSRTCRCGRPLDSFGHHRAACSRAGVLGRRGFAVESIGARICREGGARVSTNVHVFVLDILAPEVHDGRRIEIIAEGLPLFGGAQLAVDTTLVSAHHCDGSARARAV